MGEDFLLSLDLGQVDDFAALAAASRRWVASPRTGKALPHLTVRHLARWELGTAYPVVVEDVSALVKRPPLRDPLLAIDRTGVGRAVYDLFSEARPAARLRPIVITAGLNAEKQEDGTWHVPKAELVGAVQAMLQTKRLEIVPTLKLAPVLAAEMKDFKVKVTEKANETFSARSGQNDDLCLAVAMLCWLAQQEGQPRPFHGAAGGTAPQVAPLPGGYLQAVYPGRPRPWHG